MIKITNCQVVFIISIWLVILLTGNISFAFQRTTLLHDEQQAVDSKLNKTEASQSKPPNIILIMADDIGLEAFSSFPTPQLDELARQGMNFNYAYSMPLCTPSRVQLMTGKYNFRNYERWGYLNQNETTFAHLLKSAGYATCIAGKWQLRGDAYAPYKSGFDEYCLWQLTFTSYNERYKNPRIIENGHLTKYSNGEYGPQLFTDYILDFMERHKEEPFFVYYPMALTHRPYVPSPDSDGYEDFNITDSESSSGSGSNAKYFKDEVAYMDKVVGEIVQKTHELNISEHTLILFTGDNGTGHEITSQVEGQQIVGQKGETNEYGTHVPLIAYWDGVIQAGQQNNNLIDFTDFLPTLCEGAGVQLPESFVTDGISFYSQLTGQPYQPREWVFCHYDPKKSDYKKKRFVHNKEWKLYENGEFYHIKNDPYEKHPVQEEALSDEVKQLKNQFTKVLLTMKKDA